MVSAFPYASPGAVRLAGGSAPARAHRQRAVRRRARGGDGGCARGGGRRSRDGSSPRSTPWSQRWEATSGAACPQCASSSTRMVSTARCSNGSWRTSFERFPPEARPTEARGSSFPTSSSHPRSPRTRSSTRGEALARRHLGTLGGGNHFIELDRDAEGQLWLLVHSGSVGSGHRSPIIRARR